MSRMRAVALSKSEALELGEPVQLAVDDPLRAAALVDREHVFFVIAVMTA